LAVAFQNQAQTKGKYGTANDVYPLGVIISEMLTGLNSLLTADECVRALQLADQDAATWPAGRHSGSYMDDGDEAKIYLWMEYGMRVPLATVIQFILRKHQHVPKALWHPAWFTGQDTAEIAAAESAGEVLHAQVCLCFDIKELGRSKLPAVLGAMRPAVVAALKHG
jgi:hypothetical protein